MTEPPNLFTYRDRYPNHPGYKRPGTSEQAARQIRTRAPSLRNRVLHLLESTPTGLTADECAERMDISILSTRPRVSELLRLGKIYDSGHTRRNASGVSAVVWRSYY